MSIIQLPGPRLIGFRWFTIRPGIVALFGVAHQRQMPFSGGRWEAECGLGFQTEDNCRGAQHGSAPSRQCTCGFYAFSNTHHLREQGFWSSAPVVAGVVLGWGRIIPAEKGWRSQFQQLVGIVDMDSPAKARLYSWSFKTPFRRAIAERYQVEFVNQGRGSADGHDVLDAAINAFAESIPNAYRMDQVPANYRVRPQRLAPSSSRTDPRWFNRDCECGCGGLPKRGEFLPGHDAKLKSRLLREARDGSWVAHAALQVRGWAEISSPVNIDMNAPDML